MTDLDNKKMSNDEFLKEFDVLVNSALLRHNLIQPTSSNDANRRVVNKCSNENVNPYGAGSKQIIPNNIISSGSTSSSSSSSSGICESGGSSFSNYKFNKLNEKLKFNHEFIETFKIANIQLNKADLVESCKLKCKSNQLNNAAQQNKDETHHAKIKNNKPKTSTACNQPKTLKKNAHSDADLKIKTKTNENNNPNRSKPAAFCKSETKPLTSKPIRKSNSEFANLSNKHRDIDPKLLKKPIVLPARKNSINTDTVSSNSSDLKPLSEKTNTKIQILLTKSSPSPKQSVQRNEDDTDLDVSDLSPFGLNKNEESKDFDANSVFSYLSTTSSTDSLKQTKAKTDRLVNSLATDFSIKKSKKNDCKRRINFKSSGSCISTSESEQDSTETSTASSRKSKNNSLDALPTLLVQLLVLLLSQNETGHQKSNQRRHSAMSMSSKNKINLKNQLKATPIGSLLSLNKKGKFNHLVDSLTKSLRKVVDSKNNSVDRSEQKLLESILLNDVGNKNCGNDNDDKVKLTSSLVVDNSNTNVSIFDTFSNISSPNPTFETVEPSTNRKARINSSDLEEINFYYDYFMKNKQSANPDEYDAHSLNLNSTSTKIETNSGLQCEDSATKSHKKHQKRSKSKKPLLEIPNIDDPILFIDTLYNQLLANKSSKDDDSMSMYSSKSTTSCTNTNASDYSSYFKRFKLSDYSSNSAYLKKNYCLVNNISCASNDNNAKEGDNDCLSDLSRNESSNSLSSRFNNSILNFNNDEEMCQTDNTFNNNYYNNNDFSFIDLYSNKTNLSNTSTTTKDCLLSINKNLIDWNYDDEDSKMMAKIELSRDEPMNCSTARCNCLDCERVNNTKASTSSSSAGSSYIENKRFSKNDESVLLFKNSLNETQDDIDASLASSSSNQLDVDYLHNFMRNSSEKLNTTQSDFNSSLLAASLSSNKSILPFGNTNINSNKNILRFSSLANIFSSSSMFHASNHQQKNNKNMLMNCKYITNSNSAALRIFKSNSTSNVNSLNSNSNNYASLMICTKANNMKSSATSPIIVKNGSATTTNSNTNYVQIIFNSFLKSLKFLIMTKNVFVLPIIIILLNTKFRNSSTVMSSASMSNIPGSAITIAATTAAAAAQLSEFYNR